jgi:hypothetical protein
VNRAEGPERTSHNAAVLQAKATTEGGDGLFDRASVQIGLDEIEKIRT